jgi:hypothetical protein
MFVIVLKDEAEKGAFSIINEYDEKVVLFFEQFDDAERYKMMLSEMGVNNLDIVNYDEDLLIRTCEFVGFKFSKISSYDFVVPPGYCDDSL